MSTLQPHDYNSPGKDAIGFAVQFGTVKKQIEDTSAGFALHSSGTLSDIWQNNGAAKLETTIKQEEKRLREIERTSNSRSTRESARDSRKQLEAARRGLSMHKEIEEAVQEKKRRPERLARKLEEIGSEYGYPPSVFDDISEAIEAAPEPMQTRHNLRPTGRDIRAEIMARSAEFVQPRSRTTETRLPPPYEQRTSPPSPATRTSRPSIIPRRPSSPSSRIHRPAATSPMPGAFEPEENSDSTPLPSPSSTRKSKYTGPPPIPCTTAEQEYARQDVLRRYHDMNDASPSHTMHEDGSTSYRSSASSSLRPGRTVATIRSSREAEKDKQLERELLRRADELDASRRAGKSQIYGNGPLYFSSALLPSIRQSSAPATHFYSQTPSVVYDQNGMWQQPPSMYPPMSPYGMPASGQMPVATSVWQDEDANSDSTD